MAIREKMNERPRTAAAVIGGLLLALIVLGWAAMRPSAAAARFASVPKAYFTVDDGKSYFPDDVTKIPPFMTADGKRAYRAVVARCGSNGQTFVVRIEKFNDADRKYLEQALANPQTRNTVLNETFSNANQMAIVKKPLTGDKAWLAFNGHNAAEYRAIANARCKDGSVPALVLPE